MPDGSIVGVRGPLRDNEGLLVRPYWLVENIESAADDMKSKGAEIAMAPTEIAGKGMFAIFILGGLSKGCGNYDLHAYQQFHAVLYR